MSANGGQEPYQRMYRADMILLERAVRHGWPMTPEKLAHEMRRLQEVIDDPGRGDRDRWRARRTLSFCQAHVESRQSPNGRALAGG